METAQDYGQAVEALKQGKRVQRAGWNGSDQFVFMQIPSVIPGNVVLGMQSLPQLVKDEFARRFGKQIPEIYYTDQLAIVNTENVISGWTPTAADSLATDWIILD